MRTPENRDFDIVVVGGAMVGGVLASALRQRGYRVGLTDARTLQSPPAKPEGALPLRTTAIAHGTMLILESLGLWPAHHLGAAAIREVEVSQQGSFGRVLLSAEEERVPALGYVVDNQRFERAVLSVLDATVPRLAPAGLLRLTDQDDVIELDLQPEGSAPVRWRTLLLVGADGTRSTVRTLAGISSRNVDYHAVAIVGTVAVAHPATGVAFERFTHSGPLALLPIDDRHWSVVCTVDEADDVTALQRDDALFIDRLHKAFGYSLGQLTAIGPRAALPLQLIEASVQRQGRVLLMGNAARSIHPVAGQGFNLAMRDVGALVQRLPASATTPDPGDPAILTDYLRHRRLDQRQTVLMTDTLARLFRGHNPLAAGMRGLGLSGLDLIPGLRHSFARRAMGLGVVLPDLPYAR